MLTLRSIGHCGHDTVNFVCKRLPYMIRMSLQALLSSTTGTVPSSELVSEALNNAIRHLDDSIRSDLFDFLPCDRLCQLSSDRLREHIQRHESEWETISARCTQGATVIFSLLDPSKRNLWVVNLGDSQAGMYCTGSLRSSSYRPSQCLSENCPLENGPDSLSTLSITAATRWNVSVSCASI